MKKIYLSLIAAMVVTTASAQKPKNVVVGENMPASNVLTENFGPTFHAKSSSANVIITDTLWYGYNKHTYRNTPTDAGLFPTYKNAPSYTANVINSGGAFFQNASPMIVSGAECLVIKQSNATSSAVPVGLYLYNATAGLPTGVAVATCQSAVSATASGVSIGCNFGSPAIITGDFVVIMKNISSIATDTIRMFMNNARTTTSSATAAEKYGEGYGIFSFGATFGTNWDNTVDVFNGAGYGSDFEFLVAPRVTHTITADNSTTTYSFCNTANVAYVNTSSPKISHRQYNLNQFFKSWRPFANTTALAGAIQDSVFTWNFGAGPNPTVYDFAPIHQYLLGNGVVNDNMVAKFQKMSDYSYAANIDTKVWTVTVTVCNVGLTENNIENQLAVYPNPASDNVTVYLNNPTQNTQIQVLNALGQVVISKSNVSDKNELNTESLSKGVYFVRVTNGKELSTTKLIISK